MADNGIERTTIRYSCVKKDHHRKAYEIVQSKTNAIKNEFIIQAIIEKEEKQELSEIIQSAVRDAMAEKGLHTMGIEKQLRKIVREELAHVSFVHPTSVQTKKETSEKPREIENTIPSDAMDFMNNLG